MTRRRAVKILSLVLALVLVFGFAQIYFWGPVIFMPIPRRLPIHFRALPVIPMWCRPVPSASGK